MTPIYVSAIIFFILIFPFYLSLYGFFDVKNNRYLFSVYLYGIKLIGGEFKFSLKGGEVIIGGKKATAFKFADMVDFGNSFKPLSGYLLKKIYFATEVGSDNPIIPLGFGILLKTFSYPVLGILSESKPSLNVQVDVFLVKNSSLKVCLNVGVFFNGIALLISAVKIITERIFNERKSK